MRAELFPDAVEEQLDAPATTADVDVEALAIDEALTEVAQGKAQPLVPSWNRMVSM
jgi:hypothetical protein